MGWISVQFSFLEYDGCFLLSYVLGVAEWSTHNYLLMAGNLHQIHRLLFYKHTWVLPECFLLWHHHLVIVYAWILIFSRCHCFLLSNQHPQLRFSNSQGIFKMTQILKESVWVLELTAPTMANPGSYQLSKRLVYSMVSDVTNTEIAMLLKYKINHQ